MTNVWVGQVHPEQAFDALLEILIELKHGGSPCSFILDCRHIKVLGPEPEICVYW